MKFTIVAIFVLTVGGCYGSRPGVTPPEVSELRLRNDYITIGVALKYGGAITYLSRSGVAYNLVNSHDMGREIQQSYYIGPSLNRTFEGQSPYWSPWPWNAIQAGDAYGDLGAVLDYSNDGKTIYTKTRPLLWDMKNETAECFMEEWISLEDRVATVRNRLTTFIRSDKWNKVVPHDQELPALYTIGNLHNLYTYTGVEPFKNRQLTKITNSGPPWANWETPEHWAAQVDNNAFGVGVYNPNCTKFIGGFAGKPGGLAKDDSCGYIAPVRVERFGRDTTYEYTYYLIVGTLAEIRQAVYDMAKAKR